jgi:hypothetical protein
VRMLRLQPRQRRSPPTPLLSQAPGACASALGVPSFETLSSIAAGGSLLEAAAPAVCPSSGTRAPETISILIETKGR